MNDKCPECNGTGRILLFTSATECKRCFGTGKMPATIQKIAAPEYLYMTYVMVAQNSCGWEYPRKNNV